MSDSDPTLTPTPSTSPPFRPLALQPQPKYLQLHLPGVPWYYFHEFLQTYMSNRNAKESALALDLAYDPTTKTLTLGDAEINLTPTTSEWTNFPDPGPKGIHRMATPISSLTYHIGGVNRLPGRRVFAEGMYKVDAVAGRLEVTVKVRRINGAGQADYEGDHSDDYAGDRIFKVVLEGTGQGVWTIVGGEGVEFQDQEVEGEGEGV